MDVYVCHNNLDLSGTKPDGNSAIMTIMVNYDTSDLAYFLPLRKTRVFTIMLSVCSFPGSKFEQVDRFVYKVVWMF